MTGISACEFAAFQRLLHESTGIFLGEHKRALVSGRLGGRLRACGVESYEQYYRLLIGAEAASERQMAVDLLTTNETYFFREPKHFDWLHTFAAQRPGGSGPFRVWSAASSSGEEAYSVAMVLEDVLPARWEVVGSDISVRVLNKARQGRYPMDRLMYFPEKYLRRFCLKGVGQHAGQMRIDRHLSDRVEFRQVNLNAPLPALGRFDVVFLRNVLIYFNADTKCAVVSRVAQTIKPGGYLFIGHSETLCGITDELEQIAPAVYRRRA